MHTNIHHIRHESELEALIQNGGKPVVVDYWASWCGPCKSMHPILDTAAQELENEAIIAKVNIDELPALGLRNQVSSIPSLLYYSHGELRHRSVGVTQTFNIVNRLRSYAGSEVQKAV